MKKICGHQNDPEKLPLPKTFVFIMKFILFQVLRFIYTLSSQFPFKDALLCLDCEVDTAVIRYDTYHDTSVHNTKQLSITITVNLLIFAAINFRILLMECHFAAIIFAFAFLLS